MVAGVDGKTADGGSEFSLRRVVHNRPELEHFRAFLVDHFAGDDLDCWLDVDALRRAADPARTAARVRLVVRKHFNDDYFYGPGSPASRQQQDKVPFIHSFIHLNPATVAHRRHKRGQTEGHTHPHRKYS